MSARRVAEAWKVRQLGLDETTKFQDPSIVTSLLIKPSEDATAEVVVLRAAYVIGGASAEAISESVEVKCFARLRRLLMGWKATCLRMFPKHCWSGPNPEQCGMHRLGNGGGIMSDTCSTARKTTSLLIEEVARQVKAKYNPEVWAELTEAEQEASMRCHALHCWQHIRNIFLAPMSRAQSDHVKAALEQQLETFSSYERMSTNFDQWLRADYKEFHHGGRYYKGQGKPYMEWLIDNHPSAFVMHIERAEGGRQDLEYDAAVPMYMNRKYMLEFLHKRAFSRAPGDSNILEDFLYVVHGKLEFLAMSRANAVIDLRIARPMRWLAGNSSKLLDWSPFSMQPVFEKLEALFEAGARDGSVLLDPDLEIFQSIIDTQPAFKDYLDFTYTKQTILSPDGRSKHLLYKIALDEVLNPTDVSNQRSTALTIEYLQVQCKAALQKMHDQRTVLPQYLSSQNGELTLDKQAVAHADTIGCEATNDKFAESVFGVFDRMLKQHQGITREAASGLTQTKVNKSFHPSTDAVMRRKQQMDPPPPGIGYFSRLCEEEARSLVEFCRKTVREERAIDRADNQAYAEYVKARVKSNSALELESLVKEFGYALSFFDRWSVRGARSMASVRAALEELKDSVQEQLDYLREQVEMRTRGLQWLEFSTKWSSKNDEEVGSVTDLSKHLEEILKKEASCRAEGSLPQHAPAPVPKRKTFKELGTPTAQAESYLEARVELNPEALRELAERERARLEEQGEIARLHDIQPENAPPFEELLGKSIEVRWRYWTVANGKRQSTYIWVEGKVVEVADGKTTKRTPKCRSPLPWGSVRIQWPEDTDFNESESFTWTILKPVDWRKETHLAWRLAASELGLCASARRDQCH